MSGYRHQALLERYSGRANITVVYNPDYEQGLLSSVQAGAQALTLDYCFITHGDLPFLTASVFHSLWLQRIHGALLPEYQGIPGHPILVARQTLLHCLHYGHGHSVRQRLLSDKHKRLDLDYPDIIVDIDTPNDFMHLQQRINGNASE